MATNKDMNVCTHCQLICVIMFYNLGVCKAEHSTPHLLSAAANKK